jgi:hypothetical protein
MMRLGLNPPVITVFGRTTIVTTRWDLGLFYAPFMGQQWGQTPISDTAPDVISG